ncbi:MAG: ABC transporter permease [Acidobacteriota bacterium]
MPFAILVVLYLHGSAVRHRDNPQDRVMPTLADMGRGIVDVAFHPDRNGDYRLWKDTAASLKRVGIGIGAAAVVGLFLGLNMGLFPAFRLVFYPFVLFFAKIPPLALLPILFIVFEIGEQSKIVLIFMGTVFVIAMDIYLRVLDIPSQQIIKGRTLGASDLEIVYKIVLPQIFPRLLDSVRLNLGGAWLFLIAAESIAATEGLGYRIFVMRRYMGMDVIIPYVLWITLIAYAMDAALRLTIGRFRWVGKEA